MYFWNLDWELELDLLKQNENEEQISQEQLYIVKVKRDWRSQGHHLGRDLTKIKESRVKESERESPA